LENVALYKVRVIEPDACEDCGMCEAACPTDAMRSIIEDKRTYFRPDCWSCGNCIETCPNDVLGFTTITKSVVKGEA
jgi:NAD-dependent dihydropyrimidine dehydrogenase PreA subunit